MVDITPTDSASGGARGSAGTHHGRAVHPLLDLRRPFGRPIPDSSVGSVRKVAKLDARTHVIAAREAGGKWYRLAKRTRFTREHAAMLRDAGISEVVLRRGLRRASFPLAWLTQRSR